MSLKGELGSSNMMVELSQPSLISSSTLVMNSFRKCSSAGVLFGVGVRVLRVLGVGVGVEVILLVGVGVLGVHVFGVVTDVPEIFSWVLVCALGVVGVEFMGSAYLLKAPHVSTNL